MNSYYIFNFFIIFLVNFLFFHNLDFLAKKINIFDAPDGLRKFHEKKVPLLGGFAISINLILFLLLFSKEILAFENYKNILLVNSYYFLFTYILAFLTLFLIGLLDDKYLIRPLNKLLLFLFTYFILIIFDETLYIKSIIFSFSDLSISLGRSAPLFAILCMMFATISQNMFDGVNLQTGIFFLFLSIFFIFKGICPELFFTISLSLIFFLYNNYKNKIFLGDSGVYVLSFITSFAFIKSYSMTFATIYPDEIFCYLFLPTIDAIRVSIQRVFLGKSPFLPDRSHFHHFLLKKYGIAKFYNIIILLLLLPFFWINFFKFSIPLLIFIQFFSYFFLLYQSIKK
jgi:UDP-GlcNAc:undecaprenyl-phosphate GlcNAc-1-phosphate transferase